MEIKKFLQSRRFKHVLVGLSAFILLLLSFEFGVLVGFKKASFSYEWGEHYYRSVAGPRPGMGGMMLFSGLGGDDYFMGQGAVGSILQASSSMLTIEGRDGAEKTIIIGSDTAIMRFRSAISVSDLNAGDVVVVIGAPNDRGNIVARLVRVMPPPPAASSPLDHE